MSLQKETKAKIVKKYCESESDTGSTAVQVALLKKRIEELQNNFKDNKKDNHSRTGLLKIVSERKKLLNYLMKKNEKQYQKIVKELKLRD